MPIKQKSPSQKQADPAERGRKRDVNKNNHDKHKLVERQVSARLPIPAVTHIAT